MATTKTLTPTNQTITLAAFTEKPDNRINVTNDDRLADAVNALNSNIPKYYYGSINTESIAPAALGNVNIPAPSGATAIKAVIPYGISPVSHWNSRLIFVRVDNTTIHYRCEGSGESQVFAIRYVVIYV